MGSTPPYRRLPGTGSRLVIPPPHIYWLGVLFPILLAVRTRLKLWLGPDHLLLVHEIGYREHYKRFYFSEIQAFLIARTHWGKVYSGVWGVLVALFLVFADLARGSGGEIVFGAMAGLFAVGLGVNLALGPTCVCHVRTAVQTEGLAPWCRLRRAEKGVARIAAQILAAQSGGMTEESRNATAGGHPGDAGGAPPVIGSSGPSSHAG